MHNKSIKYLNLKKLFKVKYENQNFGGEFSYECLHNL